jgi:signal transduction histidine kinase/CheY-like chemotaxis protein
MEPENLPHLVDTGEKPTATDGGIASSQRTALAWRPLPVAAKLYVTAVIVIGFTQFVALFPQTFPRPLLFAILLLTSCLTSAWKVNLPLALVNGSTLSMSYAANLMSLLVLGPRYAMVIAVVGAWTQCTYKVKERYPLYRTVFSTAAEAITMVVTGQVYLWLGGPNGPLYSLELAKPLVGAIGTYFVINTALVAGAIAVSTGRKFVCVWKDDFLWSGIGFMVAGSAGALAAVVLDRGGQWKALLMLAPVHLTYRTYQVFVGRLNDQKRHVAEVERLHGETLEALRQARRAEQALVAEKGRLAVALADMTRLEHMRKELLDREKGARTSAERANRVKDQFLATVSHELRTPLNAIMGWADILCRGRLEEGQRDRAYQAIYRGAKRQAQLIDDLLDVARIMSGKLRLERAPVDVAEVVRDALQVVLPAADTKRIHIDVEVASPIPAVYADGARLQQIVWNLLSNAVKFTPDGGAVRVRLEQADEMIEIAVADTGQGISDEFLPSVFERFQQGDGSVTRHQAGLGLGLSIVKQLVEAHGGHVTARSGGEGQGATFVVNLPIIRGAEDAFVPIGDVGSVAEGSDQTPSLEGTSVLVVDDDDESRRVVAAHLEDRQAVVLTAESAAQAFDLLEREHVDVLLADIAMPGEDGYSLVRKMRTLGTPKTASIPAAALTAFARDIDRQHAIQAGFQLHLTKPIDPRLLIAAVANLRKVHVTHQG